MGTCHTICKNCYSQKDRKYGLNPTLSFFGRSQQPYPQYATYEGTNHYETPCPVNHVLYDFQSVKLKQGDHQHGKQLEGFYYIIPHEVYYEGEWRQGRPHGQGQVIFKDGSVLKGWFQQGVCNGPDCLYVMKNGTYYRGGVKDNKFHGRGLLKDHNNYMYQGQWYNNLPNGFGKQQFGKDDFYQGYFKDGFKQGKGIYYWNGSSNYYQKYDGEFKKNLIQGKGIIYKTNGKQLSGQFDEKKIDLVKLKKPNANMQFQGSLVNGVPHGHGSLRFPDGRIYTGPFRNGQMHGEGKLINQNGISQTVIWHQGRKLYSLKGIQQKQSQFLIFNLQKQLQKSTAIDAIQQFTQKINQINDITPSKFSVLVSPKQRQIKIPQGGHLAILVLDQYMVIIQKQQ